MNKLFRKRTSLYALILFLFGASILIYAYSTGITGTTRKNGNGCTCHNPNPSPNVSVKILGPDTLLVGQTANYSVTITGGPLVRAGTDIAVSAGTLEPINSDLWRDNQDGELTHFLPKAPSNGVVTFNFSYTAPESPASITIYANGNSVNFDGINDPQDQWNFAPNKIILTKNITGIKNNYSASEFILRQNYPNPFNPSTQISFTIPHSTFVNLEVYNALGERIKTMVNNFMAGGTYTYTFNAERLPSGVYYYQLKTDNYSRIRKMLLLK